MSTQSGFDVSALLLANDATVLVEPLDDADALVVAPPVAVDCASELPPPADDDWRLLVD